MSYSADMAPEAEAALEKLGREYPLLVSFALDHIDTLCRDPMGLGRPPKYAGADEDRYKA